MSCIVLVGGLIGCGKTSLINYFHNNQSTCFENVEKDLKSNSSFINRSLCRVILDEVCSIEEQAIMMNSLKGWKCFRADLLLAAEHFINTYYASKFVIHGPLTERSLYLFEKLRKMNNISLKVKNVIFFIEDNFYYRSMRYDWFQIAKRANIGFCEIFLQCPLDIAISRNSSRGYNIPVEKIKIMLNFMEYPEPEKYKWEKFSITIDSSQAYDKTLSKNITDLIDQATENPAEILISFDKIKAQTICSKNVVHQADNILRRLLTKKVLFYKENIKERDIKELISELVHIRQELLHLIKQGFFEFPPDLLKKLESEGIKSVQADFERIVTDIFEDALNEKLYEAEALTKLTANFDHSKLILSMKELI